MLNSFLVGRLTPEMDAELRRHLPGCKSCREMIAALQPVVSSFHPPQMSDYPPPSSVAPTLTAAPLVPVAPPEQSDRPPVHAFRSASGPAVSLLPASSTPASPVASASGPLATFSLPPLPFSDRSQPFEVVADSVITFEFPTPPPGPVGPTAATPLPVKASSLLSSPTLQPAGFVSPPLDVDLSRVTIPSHSGPPKAPDETVDPAEYAFLAPAQLPDELGRLGKYRVLKVLGVGGMGVVFKAEDPLLQRFVALKVIRPVLANNASARERFLREARATAAIQHDNIISIYQVSEAAGLPFFAMPLLQGETLEDRLRRERALPLAEVLRVSREILSGLAAAHERGLVHRDVKPSNIWLEKEQDRVKLLDFGLAPVVNDVAKLTHSGVITGTPAYMAPEQARGEAVDPRCDLFSVGCVIYRVITGEMPFKGNDVISTLIAVATEKPKRLSELRPEAPAALSDVVLKLLEKKRDDRPPAAWSAIQQLDAVILPEPSVRPKPNPSKPVRGPGGDRTPPLVKEGESPGEKGRRRRGKPRAETPAVPEGDGAASGKAAERVGKAPVGRPFFRTVVPVETAAVAAKKASSSGSDKPVVSATPRANRRRSLFLGLTGMGLSILLVRSIIIFYLSDPTPLLPEELQKGLFNNTNTNTNTNINNVVVDLASARPPRIEPRMIVPPPVVDPPVAPDELAETIAKVRRTLPMIDDAKSLAALEAPEKWSSPAWSAALRASGGRPPGLVRILGDGRLRHWGSVSGVCFASKDLLASLGADGVVRIWELKNGEERAVVSDPTSPVVAMAADKKVVVVGTRGGMVGVADASSISLDAMTDSDPENDPDPEKAWRSKSLDIRPLQSQHKGAIRAVAYNSRSDLVASVGEDRNVVVERSSGGKPIELGRISGNAPALAFSPDGVLLATSGGDGKIMIWRQGSTDWKVKYSLDRGDLENWTRMAFASIKGRQVLLAVGPRGLWWWDFAKAATEARDGLRITEGVVDASLVSAQGDPKVSRIVIALEDGDVWNARTDVFEDAPAEGLEEELKFTLLQSKKAVGASHLALSPDGAVLAASFNDDGIKLWSGDPFDRDEAGPEANPAVTCAVMSQRGWAAWGDASGSVRLWKAVGSGVPTELTNVDSRHKGGVTALALSYDGQTLVSGGGGPVIRIWAPDKQSKDYTLSPAETGDVIVDFAFNRAGDELVIGTRSGSCYVWRKKADEAWAQWRHLPHKLAPGLASLTLSPNGTSVVGASNANAALLVWCDLIKADTKSQKLNGRANSVAFVGEDLVLYTDKNGINQWDIKQGASAEVFRRPVSSLAIAPTHENTFLLWCGADGQLGLRSIGPKLTPGGWVDKLAYKVCPPAGQVRRAVFTSDGNYFLTLNANSTLYLFRVPRK